ncbi:MAG: M23 family metallopeptidase [Sphingomonadales bacterium]|nr:M23 family metallopeptidase [Sphingomonadales bacterium]
MLAPGACVVLWSRIEVEQAVVWREGAAASMHLRMLTGEWVILPETATITRPKWRDKLPQIDFAQDLSEDIGTPRWWRGLALMAALIAAALGFLPHLSRLEAAPAMRLDVTAQEEMRSQMIAPLAAGGDSGRHMSATRLAVATASAPERARVEMVATLAAGDSLGRLLQRAGASAGDAARASELIAARVPLAEIPGGTRLDIALGAHGGDGRTVERLALRPRFDLDLLLSRRGGGLVLESRALAVDETPLRIRGLAGPSLYRAARAAGAPIRALQQYLQALDAHMSLDEIQPTDSFDLILGYRRSAGGTVEAGDLLYAGLERDGAPRAQLLRWGSGGQFYDAAGMNEQRASTALMLPVAGHVTSGFGMRFHPILGYSRLHAGIDLGAPWGSPIFAVADGDVTWAGPHGGHGNYVRLQHGGTFATGYGHMSRFAVSPGMHVRAGQVIGYVGSTGLSTGPHLHYEVYQNGRPVDPMSVHFTMRSGVDKGEMAAFKARLAKLLLVRPGAALAPVGGAAARSGKGLAPLR